MYISYLPQLNQQILLIYTIFADEYENYENFKDNIEL